MLDFDFFSLDLLDDELELDDFEDSAELLLLLDLLFDEDFDFELNFIETLSDCLELLEDFLELELDCFFSDDLDEEEDGSGETAFLLLAFFNFFSEVVDFFDFLSMLVVLFLLRALDGLLLVLSIFTGSGGLDT